MKQEYFPIKIWNVPGGLSHNYLSMTSLLEHSDLQEKKMMQIFAKKIDLTKYLFIQLGCDKSKAQKICYKSNSNSRDFIFFPPKPSLNDSTNQEAVFELRKRKITEVCKKYKMNTGKPSPKIFKSVLCFSQFKVSR